MPVQPPISHKHESLASAMRTLKTMLGRESFRKPVLATLATLLAVVAIAYGSIWMYAVRSTLQVELGFNLLFDRRHCIGVIHIDVNRIDDIYFWKIQGPATEAIDCNTRSGRSI